MSPTLYTKLFDIEGKALSLSSVQKYTVTYHIRFVSSFVRAVETVPPQHDLKPQHPGVREEKMILHLILAALVTFIAVVAIWELRLQAFCENVSARRVFRKPRRRS